VETKICSKCGVKKPIDEFAVQNQGRRGNMCKVCKAKYRREWYQNNTDRAKASGSKRYDNNKSEILRKQREYGAANKTRNVAAGVSVITKTCCCCNEDLPASQFHKNSTRKDGLSNKCKGCRKQDSKTYYIENKDTIREKQTEYNARNADKASERRRVTRTSRGDVIREQNRNSHQERMKDPVKKLRHTIRARFKTAFNGNFSGGAAIEALGCSVLELKQHLESMFYDNMETGEKMTWDNYGLFGWHVDHIIPVSTILGRDDVAQISIVCHYTNLRPLWAKENLVKGAKLERETA
jgi:hypothetical protein